MNKDVEAYVKGCETCQRTKSSNQAKAAPLHPNAIPAEPWTHITVDMITGLPDSNGYDALLIVVDRFSKAIIPVPCNKDLSAEGWARILRDHVYAHHGMPQVVISDQGPQFISKFMTELYRMLDIKQNASTAFHPQTDRQTERVNQEIEKYLRIFVGFRQDDWANWLPLAEFAHNNRIHSATGKSPFMILYGRNPRIMPNSPRPANSKIPAASDFSREMTKIHKETETALEEAAGRMKAQYDKHKRPSQNYQKKLDDKRVALPPHWKIHPRFNEKLLTPFVPPSFPNQEQPPPPPPDLIEEEEQWELEEVLDSKTRKWKGWTREHNSWVAEVDMGNAQEAIADYVKKTQSNERVAVVKIAMTSKSPLTLIINHRFSPDGDVSYLAQWEDGTQKWLLNPDVNDYGNYFVEYWQNYHSSQHNAQEMNA
ncbi:uncharacterized protein ARMOST_21117 [Armillaria ostoyae]|uniref:Integrase catalytic domain-containing protein n=1 Tax=Armillaria ostoyae TaxID=47428 RepID=A0A284S9B1_ARMOS|nr:uncharacterized protein ARMOST_21117 [Armillaria ostoyae]